MFEIIEGVMGNVVAGESESTEAFGEVKLNGTSLVKSTVNELGANHPRGCVEIKIKIITLSQVGKRFGDRLGEQALAEIRAEDQDMIGMERIRQGVDHNAGSDRFDHESGVRIWLQCWMKERSGR